MLTHADAIRPSVQHLSVALFTRLDVLFEILAFRH